MKTQIFPDLSPTTEMSPHNDSAVQCSVDVSGCCIIPMYVEQADSVCSTEYVLMWCIIAVFTSPVIMSILCQP